MYYRCRHIDGQPQQLNMKIVHELFDRVFCCVNVIMNGMGQKNPSHIQSVANPFGTLHTPNSLDETICHLICIHLNHENETEIIFEPRIEALNRLMRSVRASWFSNINAFHMNFSYMETHSHTSFSDVWLVKWNIMVYWISLPSFVVWALLFNMCLTRVFYRMKN